ARLGGHGITAVNILGLEEYLFSVVPSEMPATWHQEALRAQAVAARTYALRILNHGSPHTGFDLCDRVCCQVYRGTEREHENSTQAVLATMGLAAYFNGQLIDAVYFASSGGMTENSENVWQEARPYLRSVSDPHEFEPVTWTRTFTLTEITNLLSHNNRFIGNATGMAIGGTHPSGRVESLVIHGTNGQAVLTREEIRTFFSSSAEGSLMSRHFTLGGSQVSAAAADVVVSDGVQQINLSAIGLHGINAQGAISTMVTFNATDGLSTVIYGPANPQLMATTGDTIVITGRGFGHGVGMSQRGAEGMARNGYGFREILTHFYTGIVIH
ncbi:MAG: SpoIID/LytB domain-containing protein, partial [Defluviitaleaceae bacterium]|nr:SpoIID/LytB domain-containing protein [Defluviitaleaceae bacterium]